ncbi:MAG: CorA family divalent cation transporter [Methanomassiliicoccales archaeon]|nr:CorA family divalent cation transporter [Methanomassiliicoccales archaeon]
MDQNSGDSKPKSPETLGINAGFPGGSAESNGVRRSKAICVTLPQAGKPMKSPGNCPADFSSILQNSVLSWINFTVSDIQKEGNEIAVSLGFSDSLVPALLSGYYANYEDRETELGIMLPAVRISEFDLRSYPLLILVKKGLIVTVHSEEVVRLVAFSRYADVYLRKLPETMIPEDKLTMMLVRIVDENNSRNFEHLREIEEQADWMSEKLLDTSSPRMEIGRKIYEMKHALITYLNTLWRTLAVLHELRYGDADLVSDSPKVLSKLGLLADDVNRQIELSEHMSEVLASGLEVLQSLYNNQLQIVNNRMSLVITWLTILGTAVLVPNTLATIFGFAFAIDQELLLWTMLVLILATVNATFLAYWWVIRRVNLQANVEEVPRR